MFLMNVSLRRSANSDGFTLIELMVVVMTIALLIAIAIPTFLGFRGSAQDKAAQAALVQADKTAFLVFLEEASIPKKPNLTPLLSSLEPSVTWIDFNVSSTGPGVISIQGPNNVNDDQELLMTTLSDSGTCFFLRAIVGATTERGFEKSAASCKANDHKNSPDTGW